MTTRLKSQKELVLISQIVNKIYDLSLLLFLDRGYKCEQEVCNGCYVMPMIVLFNDRINKYCNIEHERCWLQMCYIECE